MIYADRLISYLDVVKTFKKGSILTSWEQRKIQDQTDELVKILEFLLWDLAKESTNEPPRNSSFYKKIKELSDCFNTIPLICSTGENLTFSELGEYLEVINSNFESIDIEIYFEIESDKEHIEKLIFTISHDLMSYLRKLKCWWFLCQKTKIITPLQMRWSLVNKFHGRHLTIPISGSKRCGVWKPPQLDAYLLPWKYSNNCLKEDEAIQNCPTVIICFPNGGFVEYFYFQWEWVNFYLEKGINVLIWNYRG